MSKPNKQDVQWFVLGATMALVLVFGTSRTAPVAQAQGGGGGGGGIVALGSRLANATGGCLWVFEPETQQLSVYTNDRGQAIKFIGARKCTFDLKLTALNDKSDRDYSVNNLSKQWRKMNAKGGK